MIYNPNVKKTPLAIAPTWALLESMDGKLKFNFLVNPNSIRWSHGVSLSTLNVLRVAQPLVSYQYSTSTLTIPTFYLWTPDHSATVANEIANLKAMTKPVSTDGLPPLLTLTWGSLKETRLILANLDIEEQQWRSGQPTQAEGSMSFIYSPVQKSPVSSTKATPTPRQKAATKSTSKATTKATPKPTKVRPNGMITR